MYKGYRERISQLFENKSIIADIAGRLDTAHTAVSMNYYLSEESPAGVIICEYDIPAEKYPDIGEVFVLTVLTDASMVGGTGSDIFSGLSSDERRSITENTYIKELFTPVQLRLKERSFDDFKNEFTLYADMGGMSGDMLEYYLDLFADAFILEIGGEASGDHDYFIATRGKVFSVNCGAG